MDISFNEAIILRVLWAGSGVFETVFNCKGVSFLGVKGLFILPRVNSFVRWSVTAAIVVEDIQNRKGYFENNL